MLSPPPPPRLLRHAIGTTVTPGDRLGLVSAANNNNNKVTLVAGSGTYIRQGHLYASLLGTLCANNYPVKDAIGEHDDDDEQQQQQLGSTHTRWIISINRTPQYKSSSSSTTTTNNTTIRCCPKVDMIILGRISRVVLPTHAMVEIVAIVPSSENTTTNHHPSSSSPPPFIIPLHEPFSGILRQQDLRPKSSLEIRIDDCYQPGDVILARIHASGERDFILTTAETELGVIQAICERSGVSMLPISWKEMQCPLSMVKERRKVAKPRRR